MGDQALSVLKEIRRLEARHAAALHPVMEQAEASRQICLKLLASPAWEKSQWILGYYPMSLEVDVRSLLERAMAQGKKVCMPRYSPTTSTYHPAHVENLALDLVVGPHGARHPRAECPIVPGNQLDLCLIPGLAFDFVGRRLGRGGGFYDRLLVDVSGVKCGLAFDWQIQKDLPVEPHDVPVDVLVTPTHGWIVSGGAPAKE